MSNTIRSMALAAALVGLAPMTANATLLFSPVASFSLAQGSGNTHSDGDTITDLVSGISITGAIIFVDDQFTSDKADDIVGLTFSGIDPIKITFSSSVLVNGLSLSWFSDKNVNIGVNVTTNGADAAAVLSGTAGAWKNADVTRNDNSDRLLTGSTDSWITTLTFTKSSGDFVGLNNLSFLVAGSGNVAPEPAGFGLAALALLAAGAATRRRNQR